MKTLWIYFDTDSGLKNCVQKGEYTVNDSVDFTVNTGN